MFWFDAEQGGSARFQMQRPVLKNILTYCLLWVSVNEVKIELSFCYVLMMGKSVER